MNNFFIILAAGKSKRFNTKQPKQYNFYKGKMIVEHSIKKAISSKLFSKVLLVVSKSHKKYISHFSFYSQGSSPFLHLHFLHFFFLKIRS